MKLRWLGHSAWLLTADDGTKIVFDPFEAGAYDGGIGYPPINETADILLMSHTGHPDHGGATAVRGMPETFSVSGSHTAKGIPIIFACVSRYPDDFIFKSGHPVSNIRGTEGARVIDELEPGPGEMMGEKRMLSAFFGTDLDFTLLQKEIKSLIVVGVATWACVLKTVFDAAELGYRVMVPADCCASPAPEAHDAALKVLGQLGVVRPSVNDILQTL